MIDFEKAKSWSEERLMFEINEVSEEIRKLEDDINNTRQLIQEAHSKWDNTRWGDDSMQFWGDRLDMLNEHYRKIEPELRLKKDTKGKLMIILRSN